MLFNSLEFFVFLAVVYGAYRVLPFGWQNRMLLVAGYVFYGWWDVRFLFLIAFSTAIDFSIGSLMAHRYMPAQQRWIVSLFLICAAPKPTPFRHPPLFPWAGGGAHGMDRPLNG